MPRRSTRPHVCCRCGHTATWVLSFTIDGQVVADLWLCEVHVRAVKAGVWALSVEERRRTR